MGIPVITTSHGQSLTSDVAAVVAEVARDLDPGTAGPASRSDRGRPSSERI